ncbi:MFS transporter [Candidatus Pacearchaeota archaeon]|nr:MFS transporter [Candidatus Pacearchaeota archaeon]
MKNPWKKVIDIEEVEDNVDGKSERVIHAKQKTLERNIKEGAVASFSNGISATYITPFALALKANAFHIGVLSSVAGLASPLSEIFGSRMMLKKSRKKIVLTFVLLQAFMLIPVALLGVLYWKGILENYLLYALIFLYTLVVIFGGILAPSWFSWMGDIIPEKYRGRYTSMRNRATEITAIIAILIGAFILDFFKTKGLAIIAFSILFTFAFFGRIVSYNLLKKEYSPEFKVKKSSYFSFFAFLRRFDNYGKFSVYLAIFNFALMIASPFFSVYMLEELRFSYTTFTLATISSSIFYLAFSPAIGKISDKYGSMKALYISNFLFAVNPLLWMFFRDTWFLIIVPGFIVGVANAALITAHTKFTYDSVKPEKRGICLAYTSLLIGIGTFVGSLLGGFLIKYVHFVSYNQFFFAFILSAVLRFAVGLFFLPHVKDEEKVKKLPHMHLSIRHPIRSIHTEFTWFKTIFK